MALTVALIVITALTLSRVTSLIASVHWIHYRQAGFVAAYRQLPARKLGRPDVTWDLARAHGGGALPWLPLGVKSFRLASWAYRTSRRRSSAGALVIASLRGIWRWYTCSLLLALGLIMLATWPGALSRVQLTCALLLASLVFFGYLAIIAEAGVSYLDHGAWASTHHWPDPISPGQFSMFKEVAALIGTFALMLVSLAGCVVFLAHRTDALPTLLIEDAVPVQLGAALLFIGRGLWNPGSYPTENSSGAEVLLYVALGVLWLALVVLGVAFARRREVPQAHA